MKICVIFIIVQLSILSCRELVQDEFPAFKAVPTVNSILVADSLLKVHVSFAEKIDTSKLAFINNATISLFEDEVFKEKLLYIDKGIYKSLSIIEPLRSYTCEVDIPEYELVRCSDSLPAPSVIQNVKHIKQAGRDEEGKPYPAIEFTFHNNSNKNQYFEAVILLFTNDGERQAELETITDPVLQREGLPFALFSNEGINSDWYTMRINYSTGGYSSIDGSLQEMNLFPFVLELRSVSHDYYEHRKQMYFYEVGRYPDTFSGASRAFQLYSNITNGYGIFVGYSSVQTKTIDPNL